MRRWFFISFLLAFLAIGAQMTALGQFSRGSVTIARAAASSESERAAARVEADRCIARGTVCLLVGFALALSSVGFVIASARKREPAQRSLTVIALIFYVVLQLPSMT